MTEVGSRSLGLRALADSNDRSWRFERMAAFHMWTAPSSQGYLGSALIRSLATRDFYLACFLHCTGYDLIDLRAEGRRKIFVFRDRPTRR